MSRIRYTFNYEPTHLQLIMESSILSERAHEKKILELILEGLNCHEIGEKVGYSYRTIQRRRQSIYEKTKSLML